MEYKLKIKNLGKLNDVEVDVNNFTILAGPNNSGKSFASKILYSTLAALQANHAERYFSSLIAPLNNLFCAHYQGVFVDDDTEVMEFIEELRDLLNFIYRTISNERQPLNERINNIQARLISNCERADKLATDDRSLAPFLADVSHALVVAISKVKADSISDIITQGVSEEFKRQLTSNFQISSISKIASDVEQPVSVDLFDIAKFKLYDQEAKGDLITLGVMSLLDISTLIFLESPHYLKMKTALDYPRHHLPRRESGVPGYVHDLIETLKFEYRGNMDFPELHEKLTGSDILGGRLSVSDLGEFFFHENGCMIPIAATSAGVANLGLLALLIERKALNKRSFLFVDDPETNLHPSWQVVMAESLFELAKQGVHVVISTHSVDIFKWLDVHINNHPEDQELVALNQFPLATLNSSEENRELDIEDKLLNIREQLSEPFAKLYLDGI